LKQAPPFYAIIIRYFRYYKNVHKMKTTSINNKKVKNEKKKKSSKKKLLIE